jgi:hypothetical protein
VFGSSRSIFIEKGRPAEREAGKVCKDDLVKVYILNTGSDCASATQTQSDSDSDTDTDYDTRTAVKAVCHCHLLPAQGDDIITPLPVFYGLNFSKTIDGSTRSAVV